MTEILDQKDCKPFFMYLLQSLAEMLGPDMAKGTLQRVGETLAETLIKKLGEDSLNFASFEDILKKINPLNYFDDTLIVQKDGIMILDKCPFGKQVRDFLNIVGTNPSVFAEITELYNTEGSGYAVSPYCIIHQTFRTAIANKIQIGGKPVELLQLGCKSLSNKISYATKNLNQENIPTKDIDTYLQTHACTYLIKQKQ